ncbi:MAG: hypothetical protein WC657_00305 [Candidatus Paceibacterota bacterium]|jgi:DNA polymerase III gamma/tau subunit
MDNLFKEYEKIFSQTPEVEGDEKKPKKERVYEYSPFALQDAIGEKSAKKAWIEYEKLRFSGIEAEELIHKIISKVKDMTLIDLGASKEDLGIKSDYPYNKSKKDLKNWQPEDLKIFYTKLIEAYHRSRMESGNELDIALEKALLFL